MPGRGPRLSSARSKNGPGARASAWGVSIPAAAPEASAPGSSRSITVTLAAARARAPPPARIRSSRRRRSSVSAESRLTVSPRRAGRASRKASRAKRPTASAAPKPSAPPPSAPATVRTAESPGQQAPQELDETLAEEPPSPSPAAAPARHAGDPVRPLAGPAVEGREARAPGDSTRRSGRPAPAPTGIDAEERGRPGQERSRRGALDGRAAHQPPADLVLRGPRVPLPQALDLGVRAAAVGLGEDGAGEGGVHGGMLSRQRELTVSGPPPRAMFRRFHRHFRRSRSENTHRHRSDARLRPSPRGRAGGERKESGTRLRQHDRHAADRHGRHPDQVLLRQGAQARRELRRPRREGLLRRDPLPPRDPGLHDPGRRPEHEEARGSVAPVRHRRQRHEGQGGVQRHAAQARHRLDGPVGGSRTRPPRSSSSS